MTKTKKILLIVGVVLLVACVGLILAFCGKGNQSGTPDDTVGAELTYTVQVSTGAGNALEGVGVYIYEDETQAELVWFDKTDAQGNMYFTAPESDRYVAVLSDVPTGWKAEAFYAVTGEVTQIVLQAATLDEVEPDEVRYKLGDTMMDFTVTDTDGNTYTLSEMLKSKKAVVLNFWYIECNPCKAEFPYMNQAYALYQSDIEILAMNPVNDDEAAIAAYKAENNLSFPMVMADPVWADMLQLTAYPTTVVIDRYGVISLIHTGSIDDTDTFEQMFDYFTAEDYVQKPIGSLDEIVTDTLGTAENPEQHGSEGVKVTVAAGEEYHLEFYKVSGMYMTVSGEDFYVTYNNKKYEPTNGKVAMVVESEGIYYPVKIIIGNSSKKDQTVSVSFGALKGSIGNPYSISLGTFTMNTQAGDEEGVYGLYTAEESGTLTVRCLHSSVSKYGFFLYNLRSYALRNADEDAQTDEDGYITVSVKVKKGDQIQFNTAVARNEDNYISAGYFEYELILTEGDGEEDKKAEAPKTAYTITVTDEEGNPVENVTVNLKGEFTYEPTEEDPEELEAQEIKVDVNLTTDAEGKIVTEQVTGPYTIAVRVPDGYKLEQTQYELTAEAPELTVQLQKILFLDYVVTVLDPQQNPVEGVSVMIGTNFGMTDAEGKYTVNMESAEYTVFVISGIPEGCLLPADSFVMEAGQAELVIQLEAEGEPEPEYIDIFGEFPIITDALAAGEKAYYNVYNAGGSELIIADADAFVIINEVTYEAVDGKVTVQMPETMGRMPVSVIVGNGGTEAESYTVDFVFPVGSQQNPEILATPLGGIVCQIPEGEDSGYNYTWTATEDGTLTVTLADEGAVAGELFDVMLTNTTSYECPLMSESEDGKTVSVAVKAGEQVNVLVSTYPDENWVYPALNLAMTASFQKAEAPHEHEYTAVVTAPTCTEAGYTTYTCACGDSYKADEVAALGHSYKSVVTAPTCTEPGYTTYTCSTCGDSYKADEVAALGHSYKSVVTAPTCTEAGYTTYTCACGHSYKADEVAATGHNYKSVVTAPTCTAVGYTTYTCSACGHSYKADEVAATGHNYKSAVTVPTCTAEGYTTYTCGTCGHNYTADQVKALGHNYISTVVEPTTSAMGYTLHTCQRCGDSYKDNYTDKLPETPDEPPHEHVYTSVVTAPTCTEAGYTTYTCACGFSYVGDQVAALGHNYKSVVTAPTCTEAGYTTYTCGTCGHSYKAEEVAALGHDYKSVVTAPTCTEAGYTTYTCACGDSYKAEEVAALGHDYKSVVTAPTCTEAGYTTYTCACGDSYKAEEVAATGHSYKSVVTAPTCTETGYTTYTCATCGDSYKADEVAALGHSYKSVVTAPTCTEAGYTTYTCSACGHSYKADEVAATGHDYKSVVTAPTCTEAGYTTYTCACGDSYTAEEVAATGHNYQSTVVAPTTTSEGYTLHTCSICGDSYKDNYTDKLPEQEQPTTPGYAVTVTDYDGAPMSGVVVQILKDGKAVKTGITDTEGKVTADLESGTYQVKLAFSTTGYHYESSTAVLTPEATSLQIRVTADLPTPGMEDHWVLGNAKTVGLGGTYVTTQKDVMTYFLFVPTEAGTYRFTTSNPEAIISYWGGESWPFDQTESTDYKDNVFTLSINESYLGQKYVIGVIGAENCILEITRQGAAAFDPRELPYTEYKPATAPSAFTVKESGTLTFVNMGGATEDYTLVKGADGYYHIGTADGPIAYVCLGSRAPYVSLYAMCGGGSTASGAPFRYNDYSDPDNIVKEDYTQAILDYGACMDKTYGVYLLDDDLIHILQYGVKQQGWGDPTSPAFYFTETENYNPELGWMFAICYFE